MFKINKKVEYALMALRHVNNKEPNSLTSVKEICDTYGAPFDVTSRAMQQMVSGGLLKSEKGAHGGYVLIKDLCEVSVLEVIEIICSTPVSLASCLSDTSACQLADSCNIITPLLSLNHKLRGFLETLSVDEILQTESSSAIFNTVPGS